LKSRPARIGEDLQISRPAVELLLVFSWPKLLLGTSYQSLINCVDITEKRRALLPMPQGSEMNTRAQYSFAS
jgi:hypothetical protein